MRPDDLRAPVVAHQDFDGLIVGVSVKVEIVGDREVHGLLDPLGGRGLAREMKLTDAAVVAALELILHQIEDRRIVEPGLDVGADTVRPNERHHPKPVSLCIHQRVGPGVGTAGRQNAGDAMLLEQREHLIDLIIRIRLPVVVEMRVEDLDRLLRCMRGCDSQQRDSGDCEAPP